MTKIRFILNGIAGWRDGNLDFKDELGITVTTKEGKFFIPWTSITMIKFEED